VRSVRTSTVVVPWSHRRCSLIPAGTAGRRTETAQPLALSGSFKTVRPALLTCMVLLSYSSMINVTAYLLQAKANMILLPRRFCSYQNSGHTCDILKALWPYSRQPDEGTQALHQTVACDGCVGWRQGSHRQRVRAVATAYGVNGACHESMCVYPHARGCVQLRLPARAVQVHLRGSEGVCAQLCLFTYDIHMYSAVSCNPGCVPATGSC
jgi:hypothetical protein